MQVTICQREVKQADALKNSTLHPVLQRVLLARGIEAADEIHSELDKLLPYQSLLNIDKAAGALADAVMAEQRILIIGDFDTDGATSCAVAVTALQAMGAKHVHYLVPNRFEYGYGLTPEIVELALEWQPDLLVTVDNGISSEAGVAAANQHDLPVIITDHHLPGDTLPAALAIVNPNQSGCEFPSKNLAGVGVIFYVMLALRAELRQRDWFTTQQITLPNMGQLLDLVALGTVADVVPLDRNNRLLVEQGLKRIRAGRSRSGIQALLEVSQRNIARCVSADFGFAIAPRLNAAGRLDDMSLGIACLLAESLPQARQLANQLDALNVERREIEADMQRQANKIVAAWQAKCPQKSLPWGVSLYDPSWHQGVIGIVAGRIKEQIHRPVIVFAQVSPEELKGSARSIPGLHIRDCLQNIAARRPELINKFGGHAMAAGLSLPPEHLDSFCQAFNEEVQRHLTEADLARCIYTDGQLAAEDLKLPLAELLRDVCPWGQAFPEPCFEGVFTVLNQRLVGSKHIKFTLGLDGAKTTVDGIYFNADLQQWPNHRCEKVRLVYRLDVNEYRAIRSVQLIISYCQAC